MNKLTLNVTSLSFVTLMPAAFAFVAITVASAVGILDRLDGFLLAAAVIGYLVGCVIAVWATLRAIGQTS